MPFMLYKGLLNEITLIYGSNLIGEIKAHPALTAFRLMEPDDKNTSEAVN